MNIINRDLLVKKDEKNNEVANKLIGGLFLREHRYPKKHAYTKYWINNYPKRMFGYRTANEVSAV